MNIKPTIPDDDNGSFRFAFGYRDTDHHWSHLQGWFIRYARRILTASEFAFIHQLSCYDFDDDGISSADNAELADALQCTARHIRRIKWGLIERGLLVITHHATYSEYDFSAIFDQVAQLVPSGWFETKKTRSPRSDENVQDAKTDKNVREEDKNVRPSRTKMSPTSNIYQDIEESIVPQAKPMSPAPSDEPTSTPPTTQLIADAVIPKSNRLWFLVNQNGNDLDKPKQQDPPPTATCWHTGKTPRSAWVAQYDGKTWLQMDKTMFICYIGYGWRWSAPEELKTQLVDKMTNVWRGHRGKGSLFSTYEWADFFAAAAAIPAGLSYESPKVWLPKLQAALIARQKQAAKKTASQQAQQNPRPNGLILITDEAIEYGRQMLNGNNNES